MTIDKKKFYNLDIFFYCLILGLTACLGFAPFNLFFITLINTALSINLLSKTRSKKEAFFLGFIFGLGYHFSVLYWISVSFEISNTGGYFFGIIAVLLLSIFLAILHGAGFFFIKNICNDFNLFFTAIFIIFVLSILDWLKGNILWGFPWMPLSSIWSFSKITLHPFSTIGTWGYSFISYTLVVAIFFLFRRIKFFFILIVPFLIVTASIIIPSNDIEETPEFMKVRLVQPNIEQKNKWKNSMLKNNIEKLFALSFSKGLEDIDLVIWPETSVPFDIKKKSITSQTFHEKSKKLKSLIFGFVRKDSKDEKTEIYNSLFLKNSDENYHSIHDKVKLVPFGEFIPFQKLLNFNKITEGSFGFSEGEAIRTMRISENIFALPLICYEVIFPNIPVVGNNKYNLLINITNDGWYGNSTGPYQHLALSRIRAVQEGRLLIRVANTGISAIINYDGKVLSKLRLASKGIIDKKLKLIVVNTLYKKYGESFFYLSISILALILVLYKKERQEKLDV